MPLATGQPTPTIEDYLQTIYSLQTEGEAVISARLARWMRVTPPTAWATVHRMERDGMVEIDGKKVIRLTPKGLKLAGTAPRRHRLSERFLTDMLGLGWAEAHEEAHRFEHGVSPRVEQAIYEILNQPTTCPHGRPIPGPGARLGPHLWRPSRYTPLGARHLESPVIVMAAIVPLEPRKLGPPESPKQVPPSPVALFWDSRSQARFRASNEDGGP